MTERSYLIGIKRSIFILLLVVSIAFADQALAGALDLNTDKVSIGAPSALLKDLETGRILYELNARSPRAIASTTKIMTGLLVLENTNRRDQVIVSPRAAQTEGASITLKAGETRSVDELLHALMMASANDAAVALAEHVAGSEERFVEMMNERARALGAKNTNFIVPHGLASGDRHFSTAADLVVMAEFAMKRRDFRRLVSTRNYNWKSRENSQRDTQILNSNKLLETYPLATGIKTGYTRESGYCLVSSAGDDKRAVIAVVLGSSTRDETFDDSNKLLNWGLTNFALKPVVKKNRRYSTVKIDGKTIPLVAQNTVTELAYTGERGAILLKTRLKKGIKLPIRRGQKVGSMAIMHMGKKTSQVDLLAGRSAYSTYVSRQPIEYFWRVVRKIENLF